MRRRLLLLGLGLVACGSGEDKEPQRESPSPEAPQEAKAPAAAEGEKETPEPVEPIKAEPAKPEPELVAEQLPSGRRPFVYLTIASETTAEVWRIDDTGAPKSLELEVGFPGGGEVAVGTTRPVLSWDGKWLAYFDRSGLVVAALAGGKKHRERIKRDGGQVELQVSGFSPDSATLLFHRGEVRDMDPVPLPKGASVGFHTLNLSTFEERVVDDLPGFYAWMQDGRSVLFIEDTADGDTLQHVSLEPVTRKPLQTDRGISQPSFNGEYMAYSRSVPGESTIVFASLDGSTRVDLTPTKGFAALQWPRPSPDNQRVAYCQRKVPRSPESELRIVEVAKPKVATTVLEDDGGRCEFAWIDADTLVVFDGKALLEVSRRGGEPQTLDPEVVGLVVGGATD